METSPMQPIVHHPEPKRGRPKQLAPSDVAETTSITHADIRQARRYLNSAANGIREAFVILAACEARLIPVIRDADGRGS